MPLLGAYTFIRKGTTVSIKTSEKVLNYYYYFVLYFNIETRTGSVKNENKNKIVLSIKYQKIPIIIVSDILIRFLYARQIYLSGFISVGKQLCILTII